MLIIANRLTICLSLDIGQITTMLIVNIKMVIFCNKIWYLKEIFVQLYIPVKCYLLLLWPAYAGTILQLSQQSRVCNRKSLISKFKAGVLHVQEPHHNGKSWLCDCETLLCFMN